jgi:hypothetical protein
MSTVGRRAVSNQGFSPYELLPLEQERMAPFRASPVRPRAAPRRTASCDPPSRSTRTSGCATPLCTCGASASTVSARRSAGAIIDRERASERANERDRRHAAEYLSPEAVQRVTKDRLHGAASFVHAFLEQVCARVRPRAGRAGPPMSAA